MSYYVYIHTCPNGKRYIGTTIQNPTHRWNNGRGYRSQLFYRAIKKYGWDNIDHKVFKTISEETMFFWEIVLIHKYNTTNQKYGYNISSGGKGNIGFHHSDTTKAKMSCIRKNNTWNCGLHLPDEVRLKISRTKKGVPNDKLRGKKLSESHKESLSKSHKGKQWSQKRRDSYENNKQKYCKKVLVGDMVFDSVKEAAVFLNRRPGTVSTALKRGTQINNYKLRFLNK